MKDLYRREYYSLKEVMEYADTILNYNFPTYPYEEINGTTLKSFTSTNHITLSYIALGSLSNDDWTILDILLYASFNRHFDDYIYFQDYQINVSTDPQTDLNNAFYDFIYKFLNILSQTIERYMPLAKMYLANYTNPMKKIETESSSSTRFNDTPQDGGDFSDDEHTTNITQYASSGGVDGGTVVEQLGEMFNKYRAIIKDWANEFEPLYIREEQFRDL